MIRKALTTTVVAALCCACGENENNKTQEHVHGPNCNHAEEVVKEHVHGPNCNHAEEVVKEHVHGPECNGSHEEEAEDVHDHSIGAAKEVGEITVQGITCDILRSCVASFYIKADKALAADTEIRATIINNDGDESLKSKATGAGVLFSLNVDEAPSMDKGAKMVIEVTSKGKKETQTITIK